MDTDEGTITFNAVAGMLVRGQLRRGLQEFCSIRHMELDIQEDKGWADSFFTIKVKGQRKDLMLLKKTVEDLLT